MEGLKEKIEAEIRREVDKSSLFSGQFFAPADPNMAEICCRRAIGQEIMAGRIKLFGKKYENLPLEIQEYISNHYIKDTQVDASILE